MSCRWLTDFNRFKLDSHIKTLCTAHYGSMGFLQIKNTRRMYTWIAIFLSLSSHLLGILFNISKTPIAFLTGYETTGLTEYIKWKLVRINKIAVWNDVIWTSIKGQMCIGNPSNITIHKPLTINSFHLLLNAFLFVSDYVHTNMKFHWGLHYTVFTKFSCR